MRGFFSATSVLLAITIIALGASIATLEQSHSTAQVTRLRNQILLEQFEDSVEIARTASAQVIAGAQMQVTCQAAALEDEVNTRKEIIITAASAEELKTQVENLQVEFPQAGKVTITADFTSKLENAQIKKTIEINKQVVVIQNQPGELLINVTDLDTYTYREFQVTC